MATKLLEEPKTTVFRLTEMAARSPSSPTREFDSGQRQKVSRKAALDAQPVFHNGFLRCYTQELVVTEGDHLITSSDENLLRTAE